MPLTKHVSSPVQVVPKKMSKENFNKLETAYKATLDSFISKTKKMATTREADVLYVLQTFPMWLFLNQNLTSRMYWQESIHRTLTDALNGVLVQNLSDRSGEKVFKVIIPGAGPGLEIYPVAQYFHHLLGCKVKTFSIDIDPQFTVEAMSKDLSILKNNHPLDQSERHVLEARNPYIYADATKPKVYHDLLEPEEFFGAAVLFHPDTRQVDVFKKIAANLVARTDGPIVVTTFHQEEADTMLSIFKDFGCQVIKEIGKNPNNVMSAVSRFPKFERDINYHEFVFVVKPSEDSDKAVHYLKGEDKRLESKANQALLFYITVMAFVFGLAAVAVKWYLSMSDAPTSPFKGRN